MEFSELRGHVEREREREREREEERESERARESERQAGVLGSRALWPGLLLIFFFCRVSLGCGGIIINEFG
ncbi:unnamed protein product [Prunus armeniaca]|uniref:Uncharacterized protein n=1 Tax=Prunus armeniaca TaxID=36596 RepID=A0A6J5XIY1_PRUAR|nr:unnamed protein product [Prunus armeniaca]